jgi:hypothetical protein
MGFLEDRSKKFKKIGYEDEEAEYYRKHPERI